MATQKIKGKIHEIHETKRMNDTSVTRIVIESPRFDEDGDFTGHYRFWPVDVFENLMDPQVLKQKKEQNAFVKVFASILPFHYEKEDGSHFYGIAARAKDIREVEEDGRHGNDLPF